VPAGKPIAQRLPAGQKDSNLVRGDLERTGHGEEILQDERKVTPQQKRGHSVESLSLSVTPEQRGKDQKERLLLPQK